MQTLVQKSQLAMLTWHMQITPPLTPTPTPPSSSTQSTIPISIVSWDFGVIIGTLLLSLLVVYVSVRLLKLSREELNDYIGTPKWDFSNSWATTLTAVGALLGTLLTIPNSSNVTGINLLSGLSLFFGLLALGAPLIYTALEKRLPPDPHAEDNSFQYQGTIRLFIVSATLTVWATSGELVTVGTTIVVLLQGGFFSILTMVVFGIVLAAALFFACVYGYRSIQWTIEDVLAETISAQLSRYNEAHLEHNYASKKHEYLVNPREFLKTHLDDSEKKNVTSYRPPAKNWSLL